MAKTEEKYLFYFKILFNTNENKLRLHINIFILKFHFEENETFVCQQKGIKARQNYFSRPQVCIINIIWGFKLIKQLLQIFTFKWHKWVLFCCSNQMFTAWNININHKQLAKRRVFLRSKAYGRELLILRWFHILEWNPHNGNEYLFLKNIYLMTTDSFNEQIKIILQHTRLNKITANDKQNEYKKKT